MSNIIRVNFTDGSIKAFPCKDKTTAEELIVMIVEKIEMTSDQAKLYCLFEKRGDTERVVGGKEKVQKLQKIWKKEDKKIPEAQCSFKWRPFDESRTPSQSPSASPAPTSPAITAVAPVAAPAVAAAPSPAPSPPVESPKPTPAPASPSTTVPPPTLVGGLRKTGSSMASPDGASPSGIRKPDNAEVTPEWVLRQKKSSEETEQDRIVWERTQRKAFMGYVNHHLKRRQMEVVHLESDLGDGVMLINFLEMLCKTALPNYDRKPKVQIQKVQNLNIAINFIKSLGIKLIGIDPQVFIDGKMKMILGTVWLLIHKFEVSDISEAALTAKDGLLLWCQNKTAGYKRVKIDNLTTSFQDGLAFCALIHKHRPDLIKFDDLNPDNKAANLQLAFDVAVKNLDIPRLLDPEDVCDVARPDERSMVTYLSQLFAKFASSQKSELAIRRIERVIALTEMNDKMKQDYVGRSSKLKEWIGATLAEMHERNFGETSGEVEDKLTLLLRYKSGIKTQQTSNKLEIEGLFNNIATKLWADSRPAWSAPAGLSTKELNEDWESLQEAEKQRELALRSELSRLHKLEYLVRKFSGKAELFSQWMTEKKDYLINDDLGASLHVVQSKVRRHEAFTAQYATHQARCGELREIVKEIALLGNTRTKAEETSMKALDDDWKEVGNLSEARTKKLQEKLQYYLDLEKKCAEFAGKAENLYVWLESVSDLLADPIVVNDSKSVKDLLDSLDTIKRQFTDRTPAYDEAEALASHLAENGVTDLAAISEYTMKQVATKWKTVSGRIEGRKRELNMEMIKQNHNERLRQDWAKKTGEFAEWVEAQKREVAQAEGELEDKLQVVQRKYNQRDEGGAKLTMLQELNQLLVDAHLTDISSHTEHTMQTVVVMHDQLNAMLKNKIRLLESQIASKKMTELTPEQLQEFKVTFAHFDCDGDNKLSISEFKAGCQGLGIDLTNGELAQSVDDEGFVHFEQFIQFMVSKTQIRDTFDEVLSSFQQLAGGKDFMTDDDVRNTFKGHTVDYLIKNMISASDEEGGGRDYSGFTSSVFER